jgi:hypothetical protein
MIDKMGNNYSISHTFFGEEFRIHKLEIRIPLKLDLNKFKLKECSLPTSFEYTSSEYYIMRWDWYASEVTKFNTSGSVFIIYSYEFPLEDFIYNSYTTLILGVLLGFGLDRIYDKFWKKKKSLKSKGKK